MYKLIAIDMDGTLLDSYGKVSLENKEAIEKALQKNIEVVIASRKNAKSNFAICKRNKSK